MRVPSGRGLTGGGDLSKFVLIMTRLRRALGPVAAVWLCCQLALLAAPPLLVGAGVAAPLVECTCTHGDHGVCPMHHAPAPEGTRCLMRGAGNSSTAVLATVYTLVGVLTVPTRTVVPPAASVYFHSDPDRPSSRPAPPEPPPPRA